MHALVLSTLLFHSLGTVVIVLGMALKSCLPVRRSALTWELAEADAAVRPALAEAQLRRAA